MGGRQLVRRCGFVLAVLALSSGVACASPGSSVSGFRQPSFSVQRVAGGSSAFDGTWLVLFSCPGAADGAGGYTRRFMASVRDGALHGEIGVRNQAAYLALDGMIQPDGSALLTGAGMTGSPDYAVGRPAPATPYHFTLQARFAGGRGTGRRMETRACEAVFTRQ